MRRVLALAIMLSLFGAPILTGCDKTVSEKESKTVQPNGTVTKDEQTVKQKPNGDVVKDETHSVTR